MRRVAGVNLLLGLALLTTLPAVTGAEIYTYRDAKGTVSYVDDPGKIPSRYRDQARPMENLQDISIMEAGPSPGGRARTGEKQPAKRQAKARERFSGTIEMYVTAWCPHCKDAESYLKKMGYAYTKYDIEKDPSAKARAADYPGRGVPLFVIGKRSLRGFSPASLEQQLETD